MINFWRSVYYTDRQKLIIVWPCTYQNTPPKMKLCVA